MRKVVLGAETVSFLEKDFPILSSSLEHIAAHSANVNLAKDVHKNLIASAERRLEQAIERADHRLAKALSKELSNAQT